MDQCLFPMLPPLIDAPCPQEARLVERLHRAGLRPTRQRLALAALLLGPHSPHGHITADQAYALLRQNDKGASLATVYNSLNQFTAAGLLQPALLHPDRRHFDANTQPHHHLVLDDCEIYDIATSAITFSRLPALPVSVKIESIEVTIRARRV